MGLNGTISCDFGLYELEALEPRIMLSADGLEVLAAGSALAPVIVEDAHTDPQSEAPGSSGELVYDPAVDVYDELCVPENQETDRPIPDENREAIVQKATSTADHAVDTDDFTLDDAPIPAAVCFDGHNVMTARMVETLDCANAPPATTETTSNIRHSMGGGGFDPDDQIVNGTVTGSVSGSGLAGIGVSAYSVDDPWNPVASGVTGSTGAYSINWLGGGDFIIHFVDPTGAHFDTWYGDHPEREGATVLSLEGGSTTNNINIALEPAGRISGTVTAAADGSPIAGAFVDAWPANGWMPIASTQTAADGTYTVGGLPSGDYNLQLWGGWSTEYRRMTVEEVAATAGGITTGIDAALEQGAAISGTVTDMGGDPVAGVQVTARLADNQWAGSWNTFTAADGTYLIGELDDGSYKLEFQWGATRTWHGGVDFASATAVAVTAAAPATGIDLQIERGASIAGLVTNSVGVGIPFVQVRVTPTDDQWSSLLNTNTDLDGYYTVNGLAAGDYKIEFDGNQEGYLRNWYGGANFSEATVLSVAAGENLTGKNAELEKGAAIAGRITGADDGAPIAHAQINLLDPVEDWGGHHGMDWAEADLRGYYMMRGIGPGDYKLRFDPSWENPGGHTSVFFDGRADFDSADVITLGVGESMRADAALPVGGSIVGRVLDPGGNPVADVNVTVYTTDTYNWVTNANTDEQGVFSADGLSAGEFKMQFWPGPDRGLISQWYDGRNSWETADGVAVTLGAETDIGDVHLESAGSISGTVYDENGVGMGGVSVRAYRGSQSWSSATTTTAADGSYTLYISVAGDYKVGFHAQSVNYITEYYDNVATLSAATVISITLGLDVAGIDAVLYPMASVSGALTDSVTGDGIAGATVTLRTPQWMWTYPSATTAADGSYTVYYSATETTTMRLLFEHPDYFIQWYDGQPDQNSADTFDIDIGEALSGYDAALVRGASISGTVTAAATGAALGAITVSLHDPANPESLLRQTTTDSQGYYVFRRLEAGDYIVRFRNGAYIPVWYDGSPDAENATALSLVVGENTEADAALHLGARIEGTVSHGPDNLPLASVFVGAYDASETLVKSVYTSSNGAYALTGLTDGNYYVVFSRYGYVTQWHEDRPDFDSADPITVTAPEVVSGMDAHLKAPDLVVTDFNAPEFAGIGGPVELSWTVRNDGDAPASGIWQDRVYLSEDTNLNTLYDYGVTSVNSDDHTPLAPGESYTVNVTATMPSGLGTGPKYLILLVDFNNVLKELVRTNNLTHTPVTLGAPDLIVETADAPATASSGQSIEISWTVKNIGADPAMASGWWDRVYLSEDTSLSTGGSLLTSYWTSDHTPLAAGASYTVTRNVTIPPTASGNMYLLFVADHSNQQGETNEDNNLLVKSISLNAPDLTLSTASAPAAIVLGETVEVSWTVTNIGIYDALANWYDAVYVSDDAVFDPATDTLAHSYYASSHTPLAAGEAYTVTRNIVLPETAIGSRYLLFVADHTNRQGETDATNNVFAVPVTLTAPDLTVTALSAPAEALLSETVSVSWTVRNQGAVPAAAGWLDRLYLSPTPTLGADAVTVTSYVVVSPTVPLAPGAEYTVNLDVTVPISVTLGDNWYWVVMTDAGRVQGETDETNNTRSSLVVFDAPDLTITAATAPSEAVTGETVTVSWTVTNIGGMPAPANWTDRVLFSNDGNIAGATVILSVSISDQTPLPAGSSYTITRQITLPSRAPGDYHLIFSADALNNQGESDATNNLYVLPIALSSPDLTINAATAPEQASVNQTIPVSWTVENIGAVPALTAWSDRIYLSTDDVWDVADTWVATFGMSGYIPLNSGATYQHVTNVTLPSVAAGNYYLIFRVNATGAQGETDTTNNFYAIPIVVVAPDLIVSAATAPTLAAVNQTVTASWTVENIGDGVASANWIDRIYISSNPTRDGTETLVASFGVGDHVPLVAGQSYTRTESITLPSAVRGGAYLFFAANANHAQGESDTTNNYLAAEIEIVAPDLTVAAVDAPTTAAVGQFVEVSWTVSNTGDGTAFNNWYDHVYLSDTADWDGTGHYLTGVYVSSQTPLAAGASYGLTRNVTLPAGVIGDKYLVIYTDFNNHQPEIDETNNWTSVPISISNPDLVLTEAVAPPAVSWGETVELSWTVANQGAGAAVASWRDAVYVSNSADFDPDTATLIISAWATEYRPLASGASYTMTRQAVMPSGLTGSAWFHFFTDAYDQQAEADETNNVYSRITTFSAANLEITATTAPAVAAWGERIDLAWTVENTGGGPTTASWWDMVYLSEDDQFDSTGDVQLTSAYRSANLGQLTDDGIGYSVDRTAITVPASIPVGSRYLIFVTDVYNQQAETDVTDNIVVVPITITAPDLRFDETATDLPSVGVSGNALALSWTVENAPGAGAATAAWRDLVYLSSEPEINAGATLLANVLRPVGRLAGGESYSIDRIVTLPSGLTGTRYLIVVTDGFNAQPESDETNNTIVQAIALSAPDLAVGNVVVGPNPVENGETFTVSYTVTNIGTAPADRAWAEFVILSVDTFIGNSDDITVGYVNHTTALAAGESIDREFSIQMPWGISGLYNLYIRVDRWNNVPESNETNNAVDFVKVSDTEDNRIEIVYAPPPANLRVDAVTVPAAALTGTNIEVVWRVTNHGTATTQQTAWSDRVYYSISDTFNVATATVLGTFARSGTLDSGASYSQIREVRLPENLAADDYWIFVYADIYNQVPEPGAEDDNVTRSLNAVTVALSPVPDLVVEFVGGPASVPIGQLVDVSWKVINDGAAAAAAPWIDRLYLSEDGLVAGATLIGSFTRSDPLAVGASYTRTETVIPPARADGDWHWVVVTDATHQVYERDGENNNVTASTAFALTHPDLVVTTVAAPVTALSGTTVTVQWNVRNDGSGPTPATWTDEIWLSTDETWEPQDILLGNRVRDGPLAPGASYQAQLDVVLSNGIDGTFYLLVRTDAANQVVEGATGEDNNVTASNAVAVTLAPYADLSIGDIAVSGTLATGPDGVYSTRIIGDPADITVEWTVSNIGTGAGPVDTWVDRVVLSRSGVLGHGDNRIIGEFTHLGLMPTGTQYTRTEIIQLPAALDDRFTLFVVTDAYDAVYEHDDAGPNAASPGYFVDIMPRPFADLVVETVAADAVGSNGMPITMSWTVANRGIGQTSTPNWNDTVYYSYQDDGTGLVHIQNFSRLGHLGPGDTYTRTVQAILPSNLNDDFYLYVRSQGPYEFVYNDAGNTGRSDLVNLDYIPPPEVDLTVTAVSVVPTAFDGIARDGQTVDLSWTVINQGQDAAEGVWTDFFYLAPNGNRAQRVKLGEWTLSQGLEAGKSYTRTVNLRLPLHVSGLYEVYVHTDARNQVVETDKTNNDPALGVDLTVALTPRPDLAVTLVEAPESVTSGTVVDVEWVVSNLALTPTPTGGSRWLDGVYLSLNNTLDGGDRLLGSLQNGSALQSGEQYRSTGNFILPQGMAGPMYIIVKADIGNVVDEFSDNPDYASNNIFVKQIYVDAQPVPPPDLVVSNVYGPTEAFDGTTITVNYRVTNQGAGITYPASWTDALWLTVDKTAPNPTKGDIRIGTTRHNGALEVGEFYEGTITGTIPKQMQGIYEIMVYTDAFNNVFELTFDVNINPDDPHTLNNNNYKTAAQPLTVIYTQPADLEVIAVQASPEGRGGSQITVAWTVANNGANVTDLDRWADAVYLSPTPEFNRSTATRVFGLLHEGALQRGQSYTREVTFTLPPSAQGQYVIVETNVNPNDILTEDEQLLAEMAAVTDRLKTAIGDYENMSPAEIKTKLGNMSGAELRKILWEGVPVQKVWEGPYTYNNTRAVECVVTDLRPDLRVVEVTVPETAYSGETVTISWSVINDGGDPVWDGTLRWYDHVYISPDPTFIWDRATYAGRVLHANADGLAPGESYTGTMEMTLPLGIEGRRYVYVFADTQPGRYGGFSSPGVGSFPDWPGQFSAPRGWEPVVWEGGADGKQNNVATTQFMAVYREPDLKISAVTIPESRFVPRDPPPPHPRFPAARQAPRSNPIETGRYRKTGRRTRKPTAETT